MNRPRFRHDSNLSALTDDAWQALVGLCESARPSFTADEIVEMMRADYGASLNKNNITTVREFIGDKAKKEESLAVATAATVERITQALGVTDDNERDFLRDALRAHALANHVGLSNTDPDKLIKLMIEQDRTDLMRRKIEDDRRRTDMQIEKLAMERDKLERELEKQKADDERKRKELEAAAERAGASGRTDVKQAVLDAIAQTWGIAS